MRVRNKTLYGRITPAGELKVSAGELAEFLRLHPNKAVIIRYELQPVEPSERTKNYYYGYCVREMQNAFLESGHHVTKQQTDETLRSNCPICLDEKYENGQWKTRVKTFEELDQAEANEFIDWLYQWAAENFYKILDAPIR